jgi:hypothetical protein
MKDAVGKIFSIAGDNRPVPGCTVSYYSQISIAKLKDM